MLLRFTVSNFLSISEEIEFNMFPGDYRRHEHHIYHTEQVDLLKSAAIYGANGAGKSNFVKAIHFLHDIVIKGDIKENEVKCLPFRLDSDIIDKPSEFTLECQAENKYYIYYVSVKDTEIFEESLHETFPSEETENLIFYRKTVDGTTQIEINPTLIINEKERYRYEIYQEDLLPNQSLIFKIHDKLAEVKVVFKWFEKNLWILYPSSKYFMTLRLCFDDNFKSFLNEVLPKLGTGMQGIDIESIPFPEFFAEDDAEKRIEFEEKLKGKKGILHFSKSGKEYVARKVEEDFIVNKIKTFNLDKSGGLVEFEPEEQSDGTRRILDLIPAIHKLSKEASVFIIDEMDRSLHPSLTKELIRYFMANSTQGQLIFTTHESNLLDLEIFRQDEIWFTEKDDSGSTKIYPLSDFKPRYDLDIRKGYLNGRFGAIPFLGNLKDLNWEYAEEEQTL